MDSSEDADSSSGQRPADLPGIRAPTVEASRSSSSGKKLERCWFLAEFREEGYKCNRNNQPLLPFLSGTQVSQDAHYVLFFRGEDPRGEQKWTKLSQFHGAKGAVSEIDLRVGISCERGVV